MVLARRKKFTAHAITQSSVLLFNLLLIAGVMLPSYRRQVSPQLPGGLHDPYYAVALIHAGLGTLAEVLGLYILLVAGTKWLPGKLRFRNYKLWMRRTLGLWWVVVLFGFSTYYFWYVGSPQAHAAASFSQEKPPVSVGVENFKFIPAEIEIPAGTTVEWTDARGRHTIHADDGSFESPTLLAGDRFQHKFDKSGVYRYFCSFHGGSGGKEMAGKITVTAPARK